MTNMGTVPGLDELRGLSEAEQFPATLTQAAHHV